MIIRVLFGQAKRPRQLMYRLGGTARGYQGIFTTLAAQQSRLWPNRTAGPAVYLYIAALGVNVLNCRVQLVGAMVNTWPPGIMK
jgi:hypothetical protein